MGFRRRTPHTRTPARSPRRSGPRPTAGSGAWSGGRPFTPQSRLMRDGTTRGGTENASRPGARLRPLPPSGELIHDGVRHQWAGLEGLQAFREEVVVAGVVMTDVGADRQGHRPFVQDLRRPRAAHPPAVLLARPLRDRFGLFPGAAWEELEDPSEES